MTLSIEKSREIIDLHIIQSFHANSNLFKYNTIFGSGALNGKMLLVRIIEFNKICVYFRPG